jgi:hypothetical protein
MNNLFTRSVLVLALFSPWVNASVDGSGDNCNATEGLDGWAIWCGVDTYLAQQEPTAAGPIEGGFEGVVEPDVRTVAFGGKLVDGPDPVVEPIPVVEPELEYNWQGYAMLTHPDFGGLQAGELKLKVDTATGEVVGLLTTASGQEIVFNEGAKFYVDQELIPLIDPPVTLPSEAGAVQISQFEVASEGSLLKLVTFPQGWQFSAVGNSFDPEHNSVSTMGQVNDGSAVFGSFVAGSLTPLDRMAEFATLNRVAEYSGYGMYSNVGRVDNAIKVDFGQGTWIGSWYGGLEVGAAGTVAGNQFSSNTMNGFGSSSQSVVTGSIKGNFNGNNASTLTGLLDVVKDGQAIVGTFKNVMYKDSLSVNDQPR